MKKKYFLILCGVIIFLLTAYYIKDMQAKEEEAMTFSNIVKGMSQDDVHQILGEPTGILSGFYGDTYILENGTTIIIYYNHETKVIEAVRVWNKDDKSTLNIE